MRVLAGSLLAPCWMLLYSVAAMLAITGPCYTVMFQLSPTASNHQLYLLVMPSSCTSCIPLAALLHRCVAASLHLLPLSVSLSLIFAVAVASLLWLLHRCCGWSRTQWLLASDGWLARSWLAPICSWLLPTATYNKRYATTFFVIPSQNLHWMHTQ
ncbi:hypothetical protein V8C86DRAFT_2610312 [Haematococcus lacustris]